MDTTESSAPAHPSSREQRGLELYREHGHEIRHVGEALYLVPSCAGRGFYSVDYRQETCDCPDHEIRGENCKHILAVGIYHAKHRSEASPHACNDGWVSMEVEVVDPETGEETVEEALYLCRRCASEAGR
jgi:hypothetical protein